MSERGMAELRGDLSLMPVADLVIWFANRGIGGKLTVELGTVKKQFDFANGLCIRAFSTDPREYFGQFLIHYGLITEDQLQRAFDTQKETKVMLGRILVMIGIVPEAHVIQSLEVKISETLLDAFRWDIGRFLFEEGGPGEMRPEIEVGVPLIDLHGEGLRRAAMWDEFKRIFLHQSMLLSVNDKRIPPTTTLDRLDGRIISLARHGLSIEAITLELHATDYQVAARLFELYRMGAVEPREPSGSLSISEIPKPSGVSHEMLARRALEAADYPVAFQHARASVTQDPANEELSKLASTIENKFREQLQTEELRRENVPVLAIEIDDGFTRKMSAKQRYILARIDGKRTVQAIIQVSPMRDVEALAILQQFLRDAIISLA
jgi:hypothetical protein